MGQPPISLSGEQALYVVERTRPQMTLDFYAHACILRRVDERGGMIEYPVDPNAIAHALAQKTAFSTGLLSRNTLFVGQHGARKTVIEYRPPQLTGLWLEGSDEPVRVPMPGLIMLRQHEGGQPSYQVYAVRTYPKSAKARLYFAPLPHVRGGVCWGSVPRPSASSLHGTSLTEDWTLFLGSKFGSHDVELRSKRQPKDIRRLYLDIEGQAQYPLDDLIYAEAHLGELLKP